MIYGPAAVGKSTLASLAPDPFFLDLQHGSSELLVRRNQRPITSWSDLRAHVRDPAYFGESKSIVIDSLSQVEQMATAHAITTIPNEKCTLVNNVEGYGYGKGYRHVYDTFHLLLADLDRVIDSGRNVVLIAHDVVGTVPNPDGDDFIRYEPRLQRQKESNIQAAVIEWCDHVLFIGYDVASKDGKGRGDGTRTIYTRARPTWIAKSRRASLAAAWNSPTDASIWKQLLTSAANAAETKDHAAV